LRKRSSTWVTTISASDNAVSAATNQNLEAATGTA
jgi:hypothetical protein